MRASLLFTNAFPNLFETLEFIGDALIEAAEHNEGAIDIHRRLLRDHMYKINMSSIVSTYNIFRKVANFLVLLLASWPYSPYPWGSQGLLCCDCTGGIHGDPVNHG
jgi:hypothetical protein